MIISNTFPKSLLPGLCKYSTLSWLLSPSVPIFTLTDDAWDVWFNALINPVDKSDICLSSLPIICIGSVIFNLLAILGFRHTAWGLWVPKTANSLFSLFLIALGGFLPVFLLM